MATALPNSPFVTAQTAEIAGQITGQIVGQITWSVSPRSSRIARMKARIFAIAAALTLAIGIGVGSSGSAYAQNVTGDQFCFNNFCLNAWNGGPYVNEFTQGVANNYFTVISNQPATGYVNLEFTGSRSPYEFGCIGDFGNSQTDARAGLSPCGGGNVPWGGNFTATHCPGGLAFKNVHWNGWLAPASAGDGTPYYLNSASEACFVDIPTG